AQVRARFVRQAVGRQGGGRVHRELTADRGECATIPPWFVPRPAPLCAPGTSAMSADISILKLKRGEDRRIRSGHLWIFSNEIDNAATPLTGFTAGARARVLSDRDQFLGHAYVNPHALICARIVGRDAEQPLDRELIEHRLKVALALRERLSPIPYYRL